MYVDFKCSKHPKRRKIKRKLDVCGLQMLQTSKTEENKEEIGCIWDSNAPNLQNGGKKKKKLDVYGLQMLQISKTVG